MPVAVLMVQLLNTEEEEEEEEEEGEEEEEEVCGEQRCLTELSLKWSLFTHHVDRGSGPEYRTSPCGRH